MPAGNDTYTSEQVKEAIGRLTTQLGVHVQEQLIELLAPLGIHPRHFGMLSLLLEQDGLSQHQLCEPLDIEVVTADERLTTVEAQRSLTAAGRKGKSARSVIDSAAAMVLLQSWLESAGSSA